MAVKRSKPAKRGDIKHFKGAYVKTKKVNRTSAMTTGGTRF